MIDAGETLTSFSYSHSIVAASDLDGFSDELSADIAKAQQELDSAHAAAKADEPQK